MKVLKLTLPEKINVWNGKKDRRCRRTSIGRNIQRANRTSAVNDKNFQIGSLCRWMGKLRTLNASRRQEKREKKRKQLLRVVQYLNLNCESSWQWTCRNYHQYVVKISVKFPVYFRLERCLCDACEIYTFFTSYFTNNEITISQQQKRNQFSFWKLQVVLCVCRKLFLSHSDIFSFERAQKA